MSEIEARTERVRAAALAAGFARVGIAEADRLEPEGAGLTARPFCFSGAAWLLEYRPVSKRRRREKKTAKPSLRAARVLVASG